MIKMKEIIIIYIYHIYQQKEKINIMEYYYLFMVVVGKKEEKNQWIFYVQDMQKWVI